MVVTGPFPSAGPMKAPPQTAIPNECPGWDITPPMLSGGFQPQLHLPYPHYALIYIDNTGKLNIQESLSIKEQQRTMFSPSVQERFLETLGPKIGYHKPLALRQGQSWRGRNAAPSGRRMKRRRSPSVDSSDESFSDSVEDLPPFSPSDMIELEVGDTEKVVSYYETVLKRFQQVNCRSIAKSFIRVIEPRKQVRYPYNGGRTGNPELTKPPWWPAGIMHKEPDHLKMEYRVPLLMHILRKLGDRGVTANMLKEIAHDTKKTLKGEGIELLKEVFRVRKLEERYERGEVDGKTKVYVLNYNSNSTKRRKSSRDASESTIDDELTGAPITPASSLDQPSVPGMGSLAISANNRPDHFESDKNSLFQLPSPIELEDHARHDRPYYPLTSAEYSGGFPAHDIFRMPASTGALDQNDHGFDYLTPTSFSTPASDTGISSQSREAPMSIHSSPDHLQHWDLRSNYFGSVDYSNPSSQAMPPTSIPFQVPVSGPASHPHMSHSFPQISGGSSTPLEALSVRSSPLRTTPLNNPHSISHLDGSATVTSSSKVDP